MSLTSTNTYVEPTAGTSLNTARLQQNDNFRSILSNFRSTSAPTAVNLTASGAALAIPDGMLYRSATTNALYIADSVHKKTARVGGNFTRVGIGARLEDSYEGLTANAATYEIGELVVIASADTGQTKHGSLHICAANAGAITDFIEIGAPLPVTTDINDNVTFTGQAVVAPIFITTANVGIRTDAPQQDLHVVGNALITTNVIIGEYVAHNADLNTYTGFSADDTYVIFTNGVERFKATSDGKVGIHTTSPTANFHLTGNAFISSNAVIGGNLTLQQNVIISGDSTVSGSLSVSGSITPSGSVTSTADNDGTFSSGTYTPTPVGGNFKRILNAGAFTLAAPTVSGDYTLIIQITNDTGAGAITTTGFNRVVGDTFTTTVGHDFFVFITKCNGFISATVQALQ
jgi:carbonic anhydrase/acetyltransferase-like protein (isoleucine patch superfamily)